jgi:hypothetical protein
MSISSISSTTPAYQPPQQDPIRQRFQQLAQALQSGDLASAQAAYATLTPNQPAQGAKGASNPFQQGLASIGAALQSGNLTGAQQALQTLQGQMKGAHHHHHHHGAGQSQQTASSPMNSTTDSAGSASSTSVIA